MSDLPWSKFFWSDWDSDEALQQCSLAAQGLWMRMLCICAKGDPTGYLAIAGNPLDVSGVARAAGIDLTEAETLMAELARWGVFSRDRSGRIFSRRMVREAKRSAEGRKHIKKRWSQVAETTGENPLPNRGPNRGPTTQKPEARVERKEETRGARASPGFDDFWSRYPNKVGKPAASKAFDRAIKRSPLSEIMAGLERYSAKTDDRPWCNPATWLNQDRWGDEPAASGPQPSSDRIVEDATRWRTRLTAARQKRMWSTEQWGPMPGQAGCRAPQELLEDGDGRGWVEWREAKRDSPSDVRETREVTV